MIDKELIKKFIDWCASNDFNQTDMALIVRRTRAWSSLLVNGKIKSLNFDTRNRVLAILGISREGGEEGEHKSRQDSEHENSIIKKGGA